MIKETHVFWCYYLGGGLRVMLAELLALETEQRKVQFNSITSHHIWKK